MFDMKKRSLMILIIFLIAALSVPISLIKTSDIAVIDSEEATFLNMINDNRSASTLAWNATSQQWVTIPKGSLKPLSLSQSLTVASEFHSQDMAAYDYFGHNSTDGRTPDKRMYDAGYTHAYSTYLGENIAAGFSTANMVLNAWYVSTEHRAIMLCLQYNAIGIGRAYNASSNYGWYWTTDFGGYDDSGQFDFSVGTSPIVASVIQGGGAKANVAINLLNGTSQPVSLSTSIFPAVTTISASLSSTSGTPNFASQLTVATTSSTPPGTYTITILGVSGSLNRSASFKLTIMSPSAKTLLVSVSTDKAIYSVNSIVHCQIKVTDSTTGKGVAGVAVKLTLIEPNGVSTTNKVTGSNGIIHTSYRISSRSPTGTYIIRTDASAPGYDQASGSVSFRIG